MADEKNVSFHVEHSRLTEGKKREIQELFYAHHDYHFISEKTGVPYHTVRRYCKKFEDERRKDLRDMIKVRMQKAAKGMASIIDLSIPLIHNSIAQRMKDIQSQTAKPLNIKEIAQMTDVLCNLDRVVKTYVENEENSDAVVVGSPKSETQTKSIDEIHNAMLNDKFINWDAVREKNAQVIKQIEDAEIQEAQFRELEA